MAISDRLQALREKVSRREKKVRADRQAKARRIEREEPEGAGEAAAVKGRQAKREVQQSAEEARKLSSDAKTLIATELGVSRGESESIISRGAEIIENADERLGDLDVDGDGDTDILSSLDVAEPVDDVGGAEAVEFDDVETQPAEAVQTGGEVSLRGTSSATEPLYDPAEDEL